MSKWTPDDIIRVHELKAQGLGGREIAAQMQRSYSSVDYQLRKEFFQSRWRRVRPDRLKATKPYDPVINRVEIPAHVLADREVRLLEERTMGEILLGDPSYSQSALGKRDGKSTGRNSTPGFAGANARLGAD